MIVFETCNEALRQALYMRLDRHVQYVNCLLSGAWIAAFVIVLNSSPDITQRQLHSSLLKGCHVVLKLTALIITMAAPFLAAAALAPNSIRHLTVNKSLSVATLN